jgi:Glycoside-hydrolase family GH114
LSGFASANGLGIGLKNALEIINSVSSYVQFAVNESCVVYSECNLYDSFIAAGKPIFHIEYTAKSTASKACLTGKPEATGISTVLKKSSLDGWVYYCDGSQYTTSTV